MRSSSDPPNTHTASFSVTLIIVSQTQSLSVTFGNPVNSIRFKYAQGRKEMMSALEVKAPEAVTGAAIGHKTHGCPKEERCEEINER